jgi:hypothetical protein
VDEIVVGADRYYRNAADSIIDEFRISSIDPQEYDRQNRPARDEFTMVLDRMEDHLFDSFSAGVPRSGNGIQTSDYSRSRHFAPIETGKTGAV